MAATAPRPTASGCRDLLAGYQPVQLAIVLLVLVAALPWLGLNALWIREAEIVAIFTLIVSGTNLSYGFAGELSLGQPAIYAVGAYVAGYMALHGANDLLFALVVGAVAAALTGLIVGIPGLRLASWSLAMVSFFIVLLVPDLAGMLQQYTGGFNDMTGIPSAELFGQLLTPGEFYVACILIAGAWLAFERNLVLSRHGQTIRVLKESPVLTESLGSPVYWLKVKVYVLGSIPAGLAGVLFAYYDQFLSPTTFGFDVAVGILAASVLGGAQSIYGAILGAALLQVGPFEFASFQSYSLVVYGAMLLIGGLLLRDGITSRARTALTWVLTRWPALAVVDPTTAHRTARARRLADGRVAADGGLTDLLRPGPAAAQAGPAPVTLEIESVSRRFGGVRALGGVSMTVRPGEVTAIIGPNGSGKTTLLNVISGLVRPSSGAVRLGDRTLSGRPAYQIARLGVARTFQTPVIPVGLTTADVVVTSRFHGDYVGLLPTVLRARRYRAVRGRDRQAALTALSVTGLTAQGGAVASALPLGTRRRVEVARAIAAAPRVLLLDEPASGLSEAEVASLGSLVRAVAAAGVVVILIEHNFSFVLSTADVIHVMSVGEIVVSGTPAEIRSHPETMATYLGSGPKPGPGSTDASQDIESAEPAL
jgi:branched-chain amino acid transport system permease protein